MGSETQAPTDGVEIYVRRNGGLFRVFTVAEAAKERGTSVSAARTYINDRRPEPAGWLNGHSPLYFPEHCGLRLVQGCMYEVVRPDARAGAEVD